MSIKLYFIPIETVKEVETKEVIEQLKVLEIANKTYYVVECDVDQNGNDVLPDLIFPNKSVFEILINKAVASYTVDLV